MRWKQKIPALPAPNISNISKLSLPKLIALFALLAGGFVIAARMLGAGGSEQIVVRLAIVGLLGALALVALKGVKELASKASKTQWVTLAALTGLNVFISTSPAGVNIARLAGTEALIVLMWAQWVLPSSKLLHRIMVVAPLPALLAGFMIGSAEPPENARAALAAASVMFKEQAPSATADMLGGLGASAGDVWHWLIGPIVGLFS